MAFAGRPLYLNYKEFLINEAYYKDRQTLKEEVLYE